MAQVAIENPILNSPFRERQRAGTAKQPRNDASDLNLIIEVTGERDKEKEAKVATAKTLWKPAVNTP